ncbi:melanoma inhibitory activity protein 2-like, partial [Syngnathoides biaculeatus]|uniref:melanoma inhibitory activity protein 2-like n=1 Tax=Syngnathoides biaculeatus TaxID=300417 RepID=UPI002ADE32A4
MTRSRAGIILWSPTVFFVLLPQLSSGLLSDFKICGDAECESLMSRVQAIRDHRGKDCRFLSFRRGETIFVHHKLTGKRNHLWAGSMNKQFGYFPKEAVKEEQKFVTKEIVVETQESDFLCMDDTGYPIDSSHLDTEDDYDSDLKTLPEKSEMSQTRKYTDETKSETPTSKDTASESLSTAGEEVEYQDNGGPKTNQESPETAVELKEKGGSPASSWLSSSVTEWFDGGNWDEPDNSAEVKKHLMQGDYSLMSSVTGWLRLGNKGKTDSSEDSENHQQNDRKTESFTSAMTGWLGFSGDEKAESCEEKEYDDEKEMDMKTASADNFKSRKLNLNSETQQIQEKINEMGTLGWLGNGLSRTLGFGINDQDTGNTIQVIAEEGEKIDKQKASSSWFDVEIKDILGFRKENPADTTETDTKSSRNVQGHDNRAASVDSKHRELADTSQVDQNNNPPQNQKVDMYPILNGKEGENKFDILASKNDVTSMPTFTYMVSKSVGQVVSEIKDSKKDQIEENDDPEFTKQVENIGTSNIQSIYGAADVECKGERTVTEIKFDESAKQSQVQESGSSLESETVVKESEKDKKQEEVHTKKVENIEKQQNVEYTKVVVQNKFQEKTQGEFKKGVIQKNWKVTYNNTNEDENSLEFG